MPRLVHSCAWRLLLGVWRSARRTPAAAIDAVLLRAARADSPLVLVEIRHLGGAIARPPAVPNALPGRAAPYLLFALTPDVPELAQVGPAAVRALFDAIAPWRAAATLPDLLGRS